MTTTTSRQHRHQRNGRDVAHAARGRPPGPASELAKIIEDDVRKWTAIVSKHGIKAD